MNQEKGQILIVVIGLIVIGALLTLNFLGIFGGKDNEQEEESVSKETSAPEQTIGGPERSNLYPTGTLPSGTRETKISVNTDEPAYCRYAKEPGVEYSSMTKSFTYDKEKLFHSINIVGLKNGETYEYYIRCRDMAKNKNTEDVMVRFSVGTSYPFSGSQSYPSAPIASEAPPVIANLYPTGILPAATNKTQLSINTNEPAYCRYAKESGIEYNSMAKSFTYDKEKLFHTINIVGLEDNKTYEYYVRCRDMKGNRNTSDVVIRFGIGGVAHSPSSPASLGQDITPPYRYDHSPDEEVPYYTKKTNITLKTDEKAVCKYYYNVSGIRYGQMKLFSNTNDFFHSTEVTGLSEDTEYKYYVKCADESDNINTDDYLISFEVEPPEDATPPARTILYPDRDLYYGTTETQLSVQTNEPAYCRYSTESGTPFKSMRKKFTRHDANIHTATVTGLENGIYYSFFVRCKDMEGNANTGDVMIRFRVTP